MRAHGAGCTDAPVLQFYAAVAVVWAGCTHATALPTCFTDASPRRSNRRAAEICVYLTPARMRHASRVVVFVRVALLPQPLSSSSQCRVLRESSGRSRALAGAAAGAALVPRRGFSPHAPGICANCTREWLRAARNPLRFSIRSARGVT